MEEQAAGAIRQIAHGRVQIFLRLTTQQLLVGDRTHCRARAHFGRIDGVQSFGVERVDYHVGLEGLLHDLVLFPFELPGKEAGGGHQDHPRALHSGQGIHDVLRRSIVLPPAMLMSDVSVATLV